MMRMIPSRLSGYAAADISMDVDKASHTAPAIYVHFTVALASIKNVAFSAAATVHTKCVTDMRKGNPSTRQT